MNPRPIVLGVALAMIGFFSFLTISEVQADGVSVLSVVSVIIIAMFVFGIVGALREPPE